MGTHLRRQLSSSAQESTRNYLKKNLNSLSSEGSFLLSFPRRRESREHGSPMSNATRRLEDDEGRLRSQTFEYRLEFAGYTAHKTAELDLVVSCRLIGIN